jgi:hypothetical protein
LIVSVLEQANSVTYVFRSEAKNTISGNLVATQNQRSDQAADSASHVPIPQACRSGLSSVVVGFTAKKSFAAPMPHQEIEPV